MSQAAIAVDMGGSHVEYGVVHGDRVIAAETIAVKAASLAAVLPQLEAGISALAAKSGVELGEMVGVAVGICAIVDSEGTVRATNGKYDDAVGFNFPQWSESKFRLRCRAENDTRLALLGEQFVGAAQGFEDAVLVTLGTGIGGAVLLGGRLLQSRGHKAGGLAGHLGVDWKGRICSCGNRGCAEAEASTASLDAICRARQRFAGSALAGVTGSIDFQKLFAATDAGDSLAVEMLEHCLGVWSSLTVSLIHAYDPQVIIFSGGVMRRQEAILPAIRKHIERHAWAEKGSVKIVASMLGSAAALLGAVPLLRSGA